MSSARRLSNVRRMHAGRVGARVAAALCGGLFAGTVAGCGSQTQPPRIATTSAPTGLRTLLLHAAGVSLQIPSNWTVSPGHAPLVTTISSGPAVIALWRFPRTGAPPAGPTALSAALHRLERAAVQRDPSFRVQRAGLSSLDGAGAVIIDASETVAGHLRRVRSEHVYLQGAELVLEAFSPPSQFPQDDHLVFSPVRKSLTLLAASAGAATTTATTTTTTATSTTTATATASVTSSVAPGGNAP